MGLGFQVSNCVNELKPSVIVKYVVTLLLQGIEGEDVMSLSVGGQPLPEMTPEQKKQVVHAALNTFSMMECKLIQLKDVLDSRK